MMHQHNKKEPVVENKNILPYPVRTLDPQISLVDRAREIEEAEKWIQIRANDKLKFISRQMQHLKQEAEKIIDKAHRDMEFHSYKCNFEKSIGMILHLYEKKNKERYFSMLSPADWEGMPPDIFLGSFRLGEDKSFTEFSESNPD